MDFQKTIELAQGAVLDPPPTWAAYQSEGRDWTQTAIHFTLPVVLASLLVAALLTILFTPFGLTYSLGYLIVGVIFGLLWIAVAALIFNVFAGTFDGRPDYDKAFAMLSLCAVPGLAGQALVPIPLIGWLISLALSIYGLVLLYQAAPAFLAVPQDKRALHYAVSLITVIVLSIVVSAIVGGIMIRP